MWFRRDLRLEDNVALSQAVTEADELLLLFHVNPAQFINGTSKNEAAFFKTVHHFQNEVAAAGGKLHIVYGELEESFRRLKKELPAWTDIYLNYDETGYGLERDRMIAPLLKELGVQAHAYHDHYLHSAKEIKTNTGSLYKVYTPYYNKWKEKIKPTPVAVNFQAEKIFQKNIFAADQTQFENYLQKLPNIPGFNVGTTAAKKTLKQFIETGLSMYHEQRDFPFVEGTSRLSHHLRTGTISIRTVYHELMKAPDSEGKTVFIKELAWREFYNMIYSANPKQKQQAIKEEFNDIHWLNNEEDFKKWQEGQTGFPIVDAAMQQLKETGWMHNRLRMIAASFLVKDLLIDWRWGERYFQQELIDYDAASNIGGWQWAASTGTDSVPYFRIFNPTTQSERFDAEAHFIKKYVPELAHVPAKKIHKPAQLTIDEQEQFQVILGQDYPLPLVSHQERRKLALAKYEESKDIYQEQQAMKRG